MVRAISTDDWLRLADVLQDLGNHHKQYKGAKKNEQLNTLTNAIKYYHRDTNWQCDSEKLLKTLKIVHDNPPSLKNLTEAVETILGTWE